MNATELRNKVVELTTARSAPETDNLYKESLRALLNIMGNLYHIDGNGNRIQVKCNHGNPERIVSRLRADNTLILPLMTLNETATANADDRRRTHSVIISEKAWDAKKRRATRVLYVAPRPVTLTYEINIWAKYKSDMDMLRSSIYSLFSPDMNVRTKFSDYNKAFISSERDTGSLVAGDTQDRVIKKSITISLETYLPSPKFQVTNTGEIIPANFKAFVTLEDARGNITEPALPAGPTIPLPGPQAPYSLDLGILSLVTTLQGSFTYTNIVNLPLIDLTTSTLSTLFGVGANLSTEPLITSVAGIFETESGVSLPAVEITTSALPLTLGVEVNLAPVAALELSVDGSFEAESVVNLSSVVVTTSALPITLGVEVNLSTEPLTTSVDGVFVGQVTVNLPAVEITTSALPALFGVGASLAPVDSLITSAIPALFGVGSNLSTGELFTSAIPALFGVGANLAPVDSLTTSAIPITLGVGANLAPVDSLTTSALPNYFDVGVNFLIPLDASGSPDFSP
tara:strand:+ start:860 stop:2404 length:1545 start_codon:yes stop_codon:yes gene_type:complete